MYTYIRDDFDLHKIKDSGQCFRVTELQDGWYRFLTGRHILHIRHVKNARYEVDCTRYRWNKTWKPYFDMATNYAALRQSIPKEDVFLTKAAAYSQGIRILRQDPWETLISFIISQRKSIPAIHTSIEKLCTAAGVSIGNETEPLYAFPTASAIAALSEDTLRACSLGYRTPYIHGTAAFLASHPHYLDDLATKNDDDLLASLMNLPGVGIKVASCTALFAYHRLSLAPIDVWIQRVIDDWYNGQNPFPSYGPHAGLMQQYLFYYAQRTKMKNK